MLLQTSGCRNITSEDAQAEKMFAGSLPSLYLIDVGILISRKQATPGPLLTI